MPDFAVKTAFTATDRMSHVFAKMQNACDKFASHGEKAMSRVNKATDFALGPLKGMIPALSIAGIVEFSDKCIERFEAAEVSVSMFKNTLENSKIGMTANDFKKVNSELSKMSAFGAGKIMSNVSDPLVRVGGISKEILPEAEKQILNLASGMYKTKVTAEDLNTVATKMGRILASPFEGMKQLRKMNIILTESEKVHMAQLQATGNTMGAQRYLLDIINTKYKGASEALANTDWGREQRIQQQLNANMVLIGRALAPIKDQFEELALQILPAVNSVLQILLPIVSKLVPFLPWIIGGLVGLKGAIKGVTIAAKALEALQMILTFGFGQWFKITKLGVVITKTMTAAQWLLNFAMSANPIGLIIIGIAALVAFTIVAIKNWKTFGAAMTLILGPIGMIISVFKTLYDHWDRIKKAFESKGILEGFLEIGKAIFDGVLYPIQQLLEILSHIPGIGDTIGKGAKAIQGFRESSLGAEAPNAAAVQGSNSSTNVNIYNKGVESKVETTPGAPFVNMAFMGAN